MNAYQPENMERMALSVNSGDLTPDDRARCMNMLQKYAKLLRSASEGVTEEVETIAQDAFNDAMSSCYPGTKPAIKALLHVVAPLLRGEPTLSDALNVIENHMMQGHAFTGDDAARLRAIALRGESGEAVPKGWVLVPEEPSYEMIQAGEWEKYPGTGLPIGHAATVAYRVMVKAAPRPAEDEGKQDIDLDTIVRRFLAWKLPDDVRPDGIYPVRDAPYPMSGTNLLTYDQAKAAFQHCLVDMTSRAQLDRVLNEAYREDEDAAKPAAPGVPDALRKLVKNWREVAYATILRGINAATYDKGMGNAFAACASDVEAMLAVQPVLGVPKEVRSEIGTLVRASERAYGKFVAKSIHVINEWLAAYPESADVSQFNEGIRRAADWVMARRHDFEVEHGRVDPSTNALEFGRGKHAEEKENYVAELAEIEDGIRELTLSIHGRAGEW